MKASEGRFVGLCLLLVFCQLTKIDAQEDVHSTSAWSEWSAKECSRTCGGGVRKSTRTCMNNRSDGRYDCEGPSIKYTTCNTQNCPDRIEFRASQCAMFNEKPLEGRYYKWKPYYGDDADPCALVCAANRTFHIKLAEKVVDGTRCRPDGYDICVDGKCKSAGCDRQLGSSLKEDACRVCGGEGKDCKTIKGVYKNMDIKGYKDIITIFKGATNIRIQEKKNTKNYFALRDNIGNFYLNQNWKVTDSKKFTVAGTLFRYQKDSNGQYLVARGPTTDSLTFVLVGNGDNAKISYEYYITEKGHTSQPVERLHLRRPKSTETEDKSSWRRSRTSRQRKLRTRNRNDRKQSEETPLPSGDAPPGWNPRRSSEQYQWQHGTWTACSAKCGEGTQRRAVQCFDMQQRVESKGKCPEESKPRGSQKCVVECDTSFKWVEAGWTECSQSCNVGEMSMILVCEEISPLGNKRVKDKYCEEALGGSPRQMKVCNERQCPESAESIEAPCWGTLYGCCLDRETAATGPNYAGCGEVRTDCGNTDYGCCPDGVNAARGPDYAGCPSLSPSEVPETDPTIAAITASDRICFMKQATGSCGDYKIKWSYNSTSGRCDQFWYGGCGGNENRFEDSASCEAACHGQRSSPNYPTPTAESRRRLTTVSKCEMKAEQGPCQDYVTKWFFNITSRRCEQFWYGGCRGNDNRFDSDRDCQAECRRGIVASCLTTPFGCCEDGVTAARGPQGLGCPINDCQRTQYGCCPDGVTASRGYQQEGCPSRDCKASRYGCCQDGVSFARGDNYRGCRSRRCDESPYGCCPDGVSYATGDNYAGCQVRNECERTEYGCCPDQRTVAQGPNGEGCCQYTEFGCCPDGLTVSGPNHERCRTQDCRISKYGCCRDGVNFARDVNYKGCPAADCRTSEAGCCPDGVTFVSEGCAPPDCHSTTYGCCPDGRTIARGYYHEGCREKDCRQSRYGCCPDGVSYAKGEDYGGCPTCREAKYGCCPDGTTVARGENYYGCVTVPCHVSDYGCCPDMVTAALGPEHLGCKEKDCRKYVYGCCPDGVTYARGKSKDPCPNQGPICASTRFGCCGDGRTAAQGPERYGCPETLCVNSEFGCCEDGVTFARGRNLEGCRSRIRGCAGTRFGCCEDGRTAADGPDRYGCPETLCINSEFGCCEDGVTFARGRNLEGCRRRTRGCAGTRFGCCGDGRTAAQGPERYGCPETLCINSEFGCCEDGVTFARGRNFEGCRRVIGGCAGTRFGCCEDRRTAADGPDRYGCPETLCINSEFGCCEDGVTFARGRNFEGCRRVIGGCAGTRFGCCEDGRTAADGPERYGCPETQCALSDYGCCPDGVTFARGYRHEGCQRRDCSYSRYGCCPDGVSFSLGENFAGCEIDLGCEASAYGCCPDRVTAARGPRYAGCPSIGCGETRYGCCPDGITPADGPNEAGCGCESSRFGCCPDGRNAARGPDYAGCVVPTASNQVDCKSEEDTGDCFEYVTKWFFNVTSSQCEQFWYGGCGGNNNRYDKKEECDRKCRRRQPSPTTAAPIDPCRLAYDEGTCSSSNAVKRWYYEESSRSCQVFWYSGCDGNENNFESESSCVQRCFLHDSHDTVTLAPTEPPLSRDPLEICHLGLEAGVCSKELIRWHYDKQDGLCKNFTYSGCYGNSNRFSSKESCEAVCSREAVCSLKEAYGTCQSNIQRYRYDTERGDCVAFRYSGCNGNANNFVTVDACRTKCRVVVQPPDTTTTHYEVEITKPTGLAACSLPKDESVCLDGKGGSEIAWYYDLTLAACQQFNYSGCGGNNNRFTSAEECTRTCNARDVCTLPKDSGRCYAYSQQYYFNSDTKRCEIIVYGGCGGNANRYPSIERCEKTCHALLEKRITIGPVKLPDDFKIAILVCHLQPEKGPCEKDQKKWYYEMKDARCRQFTYGGCEGNKNHFETKDECENLCSPQVVCSFSRDAGNCTPYHRGYHFNSALGRCEHLAYGDCYGNANRFYTIELCEKTCKALITTPEITTPIPEPTVKPTVEDCHLQKASGSCRARIPAWHYDLQDNICKKFYYGGCEGNPNRFETKDECEKTCNAYDICNLPKESGHCLAYIEQFYFDQETQRCEQFVYGGCGGNANRFASLEKCHIICRDLIEKPVTSQSPVSRPPSRPVEMCHLEKKIGSCSSQMSAWHYDMEDNTCKHFYYGGCEGNGNRFQTREECESICNPNDICQLPKEFGICYAYSEQYYFNTQTKRCEDFVYGGCGGNANRFSSLAKCFALCHSLIEQTTTQPTNEERIIFANPVEVCHLEKEVGPCRSQLPAWHYDAADHQCKQFYYGGCQGNANRFDSKEECQSKCNVRSICQLPKKSGQCYAYSDQYYFNSITNRCEQFVYGGCGGNANRFASAAQCMDVCQSLIERETLPTPPVTDKPLSNPAEACHLEKEVGPCRSQLPVWYYDAVEHRCKEFKYGGCQGNANRFGTREQCHLTCHPQDICFLPKESGKCYAYSEQYYFDPRTKRCEQFTYGGCGGNANRFFTADKCTDVCQSYVERETLPTPPVTDKPLSHPAEACHLEKEVGPCRSQLPVWYYDAVKHRCKEFKYGGCQGNANRFGTREQCQLTCHPQVICFLPKESGKCYAYSEQYYFDPRTKRCEQFTYGGCGGNANRFSTADKCTDVCQSYVERETLPTSPVTDKPLSHPAEACHLEKEVGPCRSQLPVWYYDAVEHRCKEFKYGGCQGNANRFGTREQCQLTCHPQIICFLPMESGKCYAYSEQYYFDPRTKRCEQFTYGGCGGNANRFSTADKCTDVCQSYVERETLPTPPVTDKPLSHPAEACHLEKEVGPCRSQLPVWYYDAVEHRCKEFKYGGCQGNANRFGTREQCQLTCHPQVICFLPKESGKCYAYSEQYYFDPRTKRCEQFTYGGCGGNANRFSTADKCTDVCQSYVERETLPTPPVTDKPLSHPVEACHLEKEVGPCRSQLPVWYYDAVKHRCKEFKYGGCQGNANRFGTKEQCHLTCNPRSICELPKETGLCYAYSEQYYFNSRTKRCEQFTYGGCEGNANRFSTAAKCMDVCHSLMNVDIPQSTHQPHINPELCQFTRDSGNCFNYSEIYYFDQQTNRCEQFVYTGCGGNANRFQSLSECQRVCRPIEGTKKPVTKIDVPETPKRNKEVCRLRKLIGPCSYNITAWYFDEKYGVCSMFVYSGCGGNKNNFRTLEECEKVCQPTNDVCNHPMGTNLCSSSKPFWVYDKANATCRHFPTGHCEENPLQFTSKHACQKQCLHQDKSTENVCHFPMTEGSCRSYIRVWYYNMDEGICKPFIYGGCEGNKNRFDLKQKCERTCNKHTICKLNKDPGICYGYNDAYYFNPVKNTCEHFVYGGCGGNANRFSSMKQCHEFCGGHMSNGSHATEIKEADKCRLNPDSGPCQERNIFWYYDYKIGICSRFFYTGCGGNENRFTSEEICLTSCKPFMSLTTYAPVTENSLTENHNNGFRTIHVTPKQTLTLQCGELFDSTGGGNEVAWTHDGQDISPSARRQIRKLELVVYNVNNKDAGMYTCRRKSNRVTPTLDKYEVVIKVPATIEYGASHMTALPNHRLAIPCQAHGVPKPLITWYKVDQQIHNDNHYHVFDNGTLLIDPFISNDVATYKCLARNDYEGKAEKEVVVTIQESLNLEIKKSSQNFHVGDKVTLTCTADGYPNTRFQWFYKDREIYSNDRISVTDGILIIRNATYDNTGIYTCRGTQANEQISKDVSVRILSMPDEVPKVCEDKLEIDRCRMIVAAKLCKRKTFHKNCCVTCSRRTAFRR